MGKKYENRFLNPENLWEDGFYGIRESAKLWCGTIRVIITLSASSLVVSLAIMQLFNGQSSWFLRGAWVCLCIAIISGLIAEIELAILHGNLGREKLDSLKKYYKEKTIQEPSNYTVDAPLVAAFICVGSFMLAIVCICFALLKVSVQSWVLIVGFFSAVLFLLIVGLRLRRKRYKRMPKE